MKAELITHMGDDLLVVNAARVSMDKEHSEFEAGDKKLLSYLARENHWTPFSHPQICMRETVPIFVARQRFKHMVGFSYNEVSRRYVDTPPELFTPEQWRLRPDGSIKQGSGGILFDDVAVNAEVRYASEAALNAYGNLLYEGVAPEQARMVLPQSMYTSYYVTGSLAAWARAYKQRIDAHAQVEIQDLAKLWGAAIEPLFPESWKVLTGGDVL